MLLQLRTLMLPVAMLTGFLFSRYFAVLGGITPLLIAGMLFISFCGVKLSDMRLSPMHIRLLAVQFVLASLAYLGIISFSEVGAQSLMVCALAPTATSAMVIAAMLGANVAIMATYTLLSNIAVAIIAPVVFSFVGTHADLPFIDSFLIIIRKVLPLLIAPFMAAVVLGLISSRAIRFIKKYSISSFYLWSLAMIIVTAQTVEYIKTAPEENYSSQTFIAIGAFGLCALQYALGRLVGRKYGESIAGGQVLGQKNTVLAIWMAGVYLDPLSTIGPASYVLWQNIVNSWQLWQEGRKNKSNHG